MRRMRFGGIIAALVAGLVCVPGALGAPPSNDNFANAAVLAGESGTSDWTNVEATKELGEPNHAGNAGGASVWFSWIAPRAGQLLVDTCDSAIDTLLAVYTGGAVDDLDVVVASDDDCENRSAVELAVSQGESLRIAVDGKDGAVGGVNIWWGMRPENDDFADAQVLSGWDAEVEGDNVLASHEAGEPLHADEAGAGSVWYRWAAPGPGLVQLLTCDSTFDTLLAIYRGTSLANLVPVVANDDACDEGSAVDFVATDGEVYFIAVDGFGPGDYGSFSLRLWKPEPRVVSQPTITGVPRSGELLTGELGQWDGAAPVSLDFWWETCGGQCWLIPGTRGVRTIRAGALQTLRFVVKATNDFGEATAHSASLTIPAEPTRNVSPPVIGGRRVVGATLTVTSPGEWSGTPPLHFSYQWERCDDRPLRCFYSTSVEAYTLRQADVGYVIRLRVNVHGWGGFATALSAPLGPILGRLPQQVFCRVPRLTGKTLRAARTSLARARCRLGKVRRIRSARKAGVIVGQTPRPGTRLRASGRVNVRVSLGRRR